MTKPTVYSINKAKIALYKMNNVRSIFVDFKIRAGSYYEKGNSWGTFHLLEHLLFAGTEKLPNRQIIEDFKYDHGIDSNGATSGRNISFWFKFPDTEIDAGIFLIEQIIFYSTIPINQFEKENSIISQKHQSKWDSPHLRFGLKINENIFGKNNFLVRDGLGQPDYLKKINQKEIVALYHQYFQPQNITMSIVGNFNKPSTIKKIEQIFNKIQNTFLSKPPSTKIIQNPQNLTYQDNTSQTYLVINWVKKKNYSLKERLALNIFSFILRSGTNSILCKKLRHELGFVYDINSRFVQMYSDINFFEVWSSVENKNVKNITNIIKTEIDNLLSQGINKELFLKAKKFINYQTLMSFDSINGISSHIINDLFYENKVYTPQEILKITDKITADQTIGLAKEILNSKNMTISVMTPIKPEN